MKKQRDEVRVPLPVVLENFLTREQIAQALVIFKTSPIPPAREICEKIIRPNLAEINASLGQDNDPMYLAYCCEYVFTMGAK